MNEDTRTEFNPDDALVYRRVFAIDQGRVVVEEKWDRYHPHCPFIDNPWNPYQNPMGDRIVRQVVMEAGEFWASRIPLKAPLTTEAVG